MAARAISTGTISFGLVTVPVKVYSGTQSKNVSFHMLHEKDKSRLKQQYVCSTCGEIVDRSEMSKGYEFSKDQYAVLTDEELKGMRKETDQSIEIDEFVPISQVDPIFFEKSYLLGPDKGGNKPYKLLHDAMTKSERVALGRFSTRGKQQLVVVRPAKGGLMLHGLFYDDEVRNFEDIDLGTDVTLKPNEIQLAIQLVDQLSNDKFEPGKYEDDYRKQVMELVDKKVAGQEITLAPVEEKREQIIDLVEALKKSLAKKQAEGRAGAEEERRPAQAKGKPATAKRAASK